MANSTELSTSNQFTVALESELNRVQEALPVGFNSTQYILNARDFLNGNDSLIKFAKQYGTGQIIAGFVKGAYLGLDAMHEECYLVPYGSTLQFMSSYHGMVKLAKKFSQRSIKDIYAKIVREGDEFEEVVVNGEQSVNFKPIPFSKSPIIGVFAVCIFEDGGTIVETMGEADVEKCRKMSKAQNSPAWSKFWEQMARKTVVRRLCKNITLDMNARVMEAFNSGTEIETDPTEIARKDIEENENLSDFIIDDEA